jgi:hypothetical protein
MTAAALILSGCATDRGVMIESEFAEVARNCELPDAKLIGISDQPNRYWLALSAETYSRRDEPVVQGRIACIKHWARERGVQIMATQAAR